MQQITGSKDISQINHRKVRNLLESPDVLTTDQLSLANDVFPLENWKQQSPLRVDVYVGECAMVTADLQLHNISRQ